MPFPATLLLLGPTGAVGSAVLAQALAHPSVTRIVAPSRRALPSAPRLHVPVVDFAALPEADWWRAEAALCCLGTTRRQAGSATAFETIEHGTALAAARRARAAGTPVLVYVSSIGASPRASSHYLRVKARIEADLAALDFPSLILVRPSLLDAPGRRDFRFGERLALGIMRPLAALLPHRYRPVPVDRLAGHLLTLAATAAPGARIVESDEIS